MGRMIEWPPGSSRKAHYADDELAMMRGFTRQYEAGEITLEELQNQVSTLHDLKVEFGQRIKPPSNGVAPQQESLFQIPEKARQQMELAADPSVGKLPPGIAWGSRESDPEFIRQLIAGRSHEDGVAAYLRRLGLEVKQSKLVIAPGTNMKQQVDLHVRCCDKWLPIEVKSTTYNKPWDEFFDPAMVMTLPSWEALKEKPYAVILSPFMVVVMCETRDQWTERTTHDDVRNIEDTFLYAARSLWRPVVDFARWVNEAQQA